jgi:hypothetical protein
MACIIRGAASRRHGTNCPVSAGKSNFLQLRIPGRKSDVEWIELFGRSSFSFPARVPFGGVPFTPFGFSCSKFAGTVGDNKRMPVRGIDIEADDRLVPFAFHFAVGLIDDQAEIPGFACRRRKCLAGCSDVTIAG